MALGIVNVGQAQAENNNYLTNEQVGVAGGLATLDGNGKLTESQRPEVDAYTQAQTDTKISDAAALKYAARLTLPNSGAPEVAPAPEREALHRLADTLPLDQVRKLLQMFQADS